MKKLSKALVTLTICFSQPAFAHARLKAAGPLKVRDTNAGVKNGPCGPNARSTTPTVLKPGQKVMVQWEETIQHPGRFVFSFSPANDQNFQMLLTVQDNQNGGGLPHQYQAELTMPNVECEACTIQMIQVMTEDPNNPSNYYSCADIKLTNGPIPPTPTPTATPAAGTADSTAPETTAPTANSSGKTNSSSSDAKKPTGNECK